jgi:diguanylate cyclase (GGDEF)-like protein
MSSKQTTETNEKTSNFKLTDIRKSRVLLWVTMLTVASILTAFFSPKALTLTDKLTLHATLMVVGFCIWAAFVLYFKAKADPNLFVNIDDELMDEEKVSFVKNNKDTRAELVSLAYTDRLTGLGNQQRMMEKFKSMVGDRRHGEKGFLVGVANMDGMKPINDLYGFDGGDEILKQCAQRLSAAIENDGFVFRVRGDEFGFLMPEIKDQEGAHNIGKILQEVLNAPFDLDGRTVRLSGSFGFAHYPDAGHSYEAVMKNIESALYYSKRGGRGRITVFSKEIEDIILENARMEQALRRAIANNEVRPHFQPIISLQDGKLLGFEALARWIDPELGFVSPAKFIPLAEERGIIAALTDKLLLHAAKVAAGWPDGIFLSFNLSSVQLVDPNTASEIISTIKKAELPPERLEIEVTETAMMSDPETAAMIIDELHRAGIRISMDDFGTGQSSLGRLRELKLDKVKIDRAFIMAIGEDKPAEHIVRAILEMCAGLDLTVVAEGIEEMNQAESLKRYGCHAGQGYLFGKPQDEHKTMGYIREFMDTANEELPKSLAG